MAKNNPFKNQNEKEVEDKLWIQIPDLFSNARLRFEKEQTKNYGCKYINGQCTVHGSVRIEQKPKRSKQGKIIGPSFTVVRKTN